jgi:hypothetical protein
MTVPDSLAPPDDRLGVADPFPQPYFTLPVLRGMLSHD